MNMVGRMAMYIDTRNMDIEDKTLDYLSANLKMKNQTDIVKHQNAAANQGQNIQGIKNDLVDEKVNTRRIDLETKYSTIALTFYQTNTIVKEVTVNDDPASFKVPFFTQLGNAMSTGWSGLNDVVVFLANGWVLFVLAAIVWYGYFMYKRKQAAKIA